MIWFESCRTSHQNGMRIELTVTGLGHCPSFKNTKMICGLKQIKPGLWKGKPFLITDSKKKKWMEAATNQLLSQLRGWCRIKEGETHGEWQKRLQTALWTLSDDSIRNMIPGQQRVKKVENGEEGCLIEIEI